MLFATKKKYRKSAHSGNTTVRMTYNDQESADSAKVGAEELAAEVDKLARERRIFHHGFRRLFSIFGWSVVYQRMSRIPDEEDRGGLLCKKMGPQTFWLGASTRTDLWLLSFHGKERQ